MNAHEIPGGANAARMSPTKKAALGPRVSTTNALSGAAAPSSTAAAAVSAAPPPPPTYYRLVIDGVEEDAGDYVKCVELIASAIEARMAYKNVDKGQAETPVTVEEIHSLAMVAPHGGGGHGEGRGGAPYPPATTTTTTTTALPSGSSTPAPEDDEDRPANIPASAVSSLAGTLRQQEPPPAAMRLSFDDGVFRVRGMRTELVSWQTYVADIQKMYQAIESGPCSSTARSRLTSLARKFQLYSLMNAELEVSSGGNRGHSTRVDNALHMKTSMAAPVLLEFIARVAKEQPNVPLVEVAEGNAILAAAGLANPQTEKKSLKSKGKAAGNLGAGGAVSNSPRSSFPAAKSYTTLRQYLNAAGVTDPSALTVGGLGLHPKLYHNKFLPYDMFSSQLNPAGPFGAKLLQAVLSTDNDGPNRGDLCGSLIRAEFEKREFKSRQAVMTEMLLDISGVNEKEVQSVAAWVRRQGFNNFATNMWVLNIVPHFKKGFDGEGCAEASSSLAPATGTGNTIPAGRSKSLASSPFAGAFGASVAGASVAGASVAGASTTAATQPTNSMTPTCRTVGQQLRNLFYPLFMATLYPTDPSWSDVAHLLMNTAAVSIQTEATTRTQNLFTNPVHPDSIKISLTAAKKPDGAPASSMMYTGANSAAAATATPFSNNASSGRETSDFYFFYYVWANLASLNALRARFGLNTLNLNPSIQEQAPAYDQLACSFLLADNVYHATSLNKCWIMQYLYMYAHIGLVMSPLRDNALSVSFFDHPFVKYFQRGLRVSLSSSSPLHFHHRVDQPLLEEYSSLLKLQSLSPMDMCEIARNSVLNSNFPEHLKRKLLGERYTLIGCSGNDVSRSGVCDARLQFRFESLTQEEVVLNRVLAKAAEGKGRPGSAATEPRTISVIAEASSPFHLVAAHTGGHAAPSTLVVKSNGNQIVLGTGATAAAAATRRLRAIAKTNALLAGNSGGDSLASMTREGGGGPQHLTRHPRSKDGNCCIDSRVAFPRVMISYSNGIDTFGPGPGGFSDDSGGAVALSAGKQKKSAYATVASLRQVLLLRKKYVKTHAADVNVEDVFSPSNQLDEDKWEYNSYYGVVLLSRVGKSPTWPTSIPPLQRFIRDLETVRQAASSTTLRRLAAHRLSLLEKKFQLHLSMNISKEGGSRQEKEWNNRDFFTAHKVDTNVQMEAGHNAHTLLEFVLDKAVHHGNDVVSEDADLNPITLRMLLQQYNVRIETMTVDELHHLLDTHKDLRRTFLSPHNYIQGRYFAELSKRTLSLYQEDAYSFAENRLQLQGRSLDEWQQLSHWFDRYGMASSQSRWMVSIPREYTKLRTNGDVKDFGEFLDNLFLPLWEISLHPAKDTKLHYFLTHISGFDCVANEESLADAPIEAVHPHDWRSETNPTYNYYMYYLWANITSLNEFRASRGLSTFSFRPQCGERGGLEHLIGGYLVADGINHGVTLAKHPVLEYLFYLAQIGIAMSPLSNTAAASAYLENPFPVYFQRGLNVSLATNAPLYFHFTREPLIEEYSIASKLWQLEFNDLSEIARNSVLQCGFPPAWKARALGKLYQLRSTLGNDVSRSRLSDIRVALRYECYHSELNFLDEQLVQPFSATQAAVAAAYQSADSSGGRSMGGGSTNPNPSMGGSRDSRSKSCMPRAMKTLSEEIEIYRAAIEDEEAGQRSGLSREGERTPRDEDIPISQHLTHLLSGTDDDQLYNEDDKEHSDSEGSDLGTSDCHRPQQDGDGDASLEDMSQEDRKRQRRIIRKQQRELDRLEVELQQLSAISQQLTLENSTVATMILQIRERLESEGLVILGGLAPRSLSKAAAAASAEEEEPVDPP